MNSTSVKKRTASNWPGSTKNAGLVISALILCLVLHFSTNSTASTMVADSVPVPVHLDPKPMRLTEAGARQALKDRADLLMLRVVVLAKDTLLRTQQQAITQQGLTIQELNQLQQQKQNAGQTARNQASDYRQKWHGARLENWSWRGVAAVAVYLLVRFN